MDAENIKMKQQISDKFPRQFEPKAEGKMQEENNSTTTMNLISVMSIWLKIFSVARKRCTVTTSKNDHCCLL